MNEEEIQMAAQQAAYNDYVAPMQKGYVDPFGSTENLKYMLDSTDLLEDVERMLLGLEFDSGTGKWEQKHEPVINEKGLRAILFRLRIADKEIKLANFDSDVTKNTMRVLIVNLSVDINLRYKEWGIDSLDRNFVFEMIIGIIHAAYTRGDSAHEKRFLRAAQYGMFTAPMNAAMMQNNSSQPWYKKLNPFK